MTPSVPYDDAVDLLDADHKAVKKMFIEHAALRTAQAPAKARHALAQRICAALTVHAQLEEEIFYPQVRQAIGDDDLIDEALQEHADAKELIAEIEAMDPADAELDSTVKQLGELIDLHVMEEREQIFLLARQSSLDLRGLALPLWARQQQLTAKATKRSQLASTAARESA